MALSSRTGNSRTFTLEYEGAAFLRNVGKPLTQWSVSHTLQQAVRTPDITTFIYRSPWNLVTNLRKLVNV